MAQCMSYLYVRQHNIYLRLSKTKNCNVKEDAGAGEYKLPYWRVLGEDHWKLSLLDMDS